MTFGELATRYITEYAKSPKRSWKDDRRRLQSEVLPTLRHRVAREIQRRDARELVQAVAQRGAPIAANRLRALLRKVFNFVGEQEFVETNPIAHVPRRGVEQRRVRVLSGDAVLMFLTALASEPPQLAAAFRVP